MSEKMCWSALPDLSQTDNIKEQGAEIGIYKTPATNNSKKQ